MSSDIPDFHLILFIQAIRLIVYYQKNFNRVIFLRPRSNNNLQTFLNNLLKIYIIINYFLIIKINYFKQILLILMTA
jgi:hypothetical protein